MQAFYTRDNRHTEYFYLGLMMWASNLSFIYSKSCVRVPFTGEISVLRIQTNIRRSTSNTCDIKYLPNMYVLGRSKPRAVFLYFGMIYNWNIKKIYNNKYETFSELRLYSPCWSIIFCQRWVNFRIPITLIKNSPYLKNTAVSVAWRYLRCQGRVHS